MSFQGFDVGSGTFDEVMVALENMAKSRTESMVYFGAPRYRAHQVAIADFLRRHRIASISIIQGFAGVGGLAHYAPDVLSIYDRTASYVDRILKGARPADLPVELPAKYDLTVNLKTAKAIGDHPPAVDPRARRPGDRMNRRELLLVAGGLLGATLARAQGGRRPYRIGLLVAPNRGRAGLSPR